MKFPAKIFDLPAKWKVESPDFMTGNAVFKRLFFRYEVPISLSIIVYFTIFSIQGFSEFDVYGARNWKHQVAINHYVAYKYTPVGGSQDQGTYIVIVDHSSREGQTRGNLFPCPIDISASERFEKGIFIHDINGVLRALI